MPARSNMHSFGKAPRQVERDAPKSISNEEISVIWEKAQRDFSYAAGSHADRKIHDLEQRQPLGSLSISELRTFAFTYSDILRVQAGQLAARLIQTIGRRHFQIQERAWIRKAARLFIQHRKSKGAAVTLFAEVFGNFTIQNEAEARNSFCAILARIPITLLMIHVEKELELARTQYRLDVEKQDAIRRELSPGEMVADPVRYRTLRVEAVMKLFHKSRSTIYRWIDEGKLERAPLSSGEGKRTSCLILTKSVAKLLGQNVPNR
jgi:hypothetical protein